MNKLDKYAVIGNPVAHSLSPKIHQYFAKQTGESISYEAILVPKDQLAVTLADLKKRHFKGLSVTLPFKQEAFQLMDDCSHPTKHIKSINTITFKEDGTLFGDNTDGTGLVRDLNYNKQLALANKKILIFGAGGAVRNIVDVLLQQNPAKLLIANRTSSKADQLCHDLAADTLTSSGLDNIHSGPFDIIINGTSASLSGETLPITKDLIHENTVYYDLMYGEAAKPGLEFAHNLGIKQCFDGFGMLVEQAAEQFYLWRHVRPDTQTLISNPEKFL